MFGDSLGMVRNRLPKSVIKRKEPLGTVRNSNETVWSFLGKKLRSHLPHGGAAY
jgi:hypothetical protein